MNPLYTVPPGLHAGTIIVAWRRATPAEIEHAIEPHEASALVEAWFPVHAGREELSRAHLVALYRAATSSSSLDVTTVTTAELRTRVGDYLREGRLLAVPLRGHRLGFSRPVGGASNEEHGAEHARAHADAASGMAADRQDQAARDNARALPAGCEFLTAHRAKGGVVTGTRAQFDRVRGPWKLSSSPTMIMHQFPGDTKPRPAEQWMAEVGGQSIPVIIPKDGKADDGGALLLPQEIAKSLAVLTPLQRSGVKAVQLSPRPNPRDPYLQKLYKDPTFSTVATSGNPITFWPGSARSAQQDTDATMVHESGHNLHTPLWRAQPDAEARWRAAIIADRNVPSDYAKTSFEANGVPSDDFAETLVIYALAKNTPCEAPGRILYRNRFRELDKLSQMTSIPKPPPPKPIMG